MTPEQWRKIEELYHAAMERDPAQRAAFVSEACQGDQDLRREVESLLASSSAGEVHLDRPAWEGTAGLLEEPTPALLLAPREKLGPYEILNPLGAGGMGEVFRARDTRLGRIVAIKILPQNRPADAGRQRRFLQEARTASALNHPNIVTLHDIARDRGIDYLVLEYVPGNTLKQTIPAGGLALRDLLEFGAQIGSALAAAHTAGIVHRDIKPANVMITPEKQVKVLDFGLAKLVEAGPCEETRTEYTASGIIMGTVAYMSPEQTRGEPLDGRSDIFSLGSVLYEAATGNLPFQGPSMLAIMHEIAAAQHPPPSSVRADLPTELDQILDRALAKNKQDRYASAVELVEALRGLQSQPQPAISTGGTRAESGAIARTGRKTLVSVLVGFLLATGAIATYILWPHAQINSIAVLPFLSAVNDASLDLQSDGLTEELINGLTHVPNLKVKGRATVFRYKGKESDPQGIGKQLDVGAVLTGTVSRHGDRLSVQADLVDIRDGSQLWGKHYDLTSAEIQTIPEEIVRQVAQRLSPGSATQPRQARRAADPQAYELYLKGRHALSEMSADRIRQSKVYFEQAIARDRNYASGYAGLADAYSYLAIFELVDSREVMPKAKEAALKALELDSQTADAYTSLGIIQSMYEWDWHGSGNRFRKAMELNPGGAFSGHWYGHYLETMGDWRGAQEKMSWALDLDPLSPVYGEDLGFDLMINRQYDEAARRLRKVVELDPEDPIAHAFLALALEAQGFRNESLAESDRTRQSSNMAFVAGTVAGIYCRLGKPAEARKMLEDLEAREKQQYVAPVQIAMTYFALGEPDAGFRLLNRAVDERCLNVQIEGTDPVFNSVRRDPRFIAVRQRIGLPEAAWATSLVGK